MSQEDRDGQSSHFDKLKIKIASREKILKEWSYGEVRKAETINYRTGKVEKGGLFCEKIFGPVRDWECGCGKYKKIKYKGVFCDRCGVEVTSSDVRRSRMGSITFPVPIVHIWFFKSQPSRIGNILGMSIADLERVIYYEEYVVIDSMTSGLEKKQLLSEVECRAAQEKFGIDAFKASIGGEAILALLQDEDLSLLVADLKNKIKRTRSMQARMKIAKRLKIVEGLASSSNELADMVLGGVPVLPPDLRPLVALDGGRFATSDLNDLYRRVINRCNRLKDMLRLKAPDVIVRNEKRMLQEAVDALFDNGRHGPAVMGALNRPLKSLADTVKGKQGRFRQNLLGKRVDYSGRSVIVVGPDLKLNQCGLPKQMALELFEPFIIKKLKQAGSVYTIRSAKKMIQRGDPEVWDILEEVIQGHPVILNRAPTLHRLGIQAFEPILIEGKAIQVHPLVCSAFNADFDGDQMAVHVPLSIEAHLETKLLMMASDNIFLPSSGKPSALPSKDILLGLYYLMIDPIYLPEKHGRPLKIFASPDEVLRAISSRQSFQVYEQDQFEEGERIDDFGFGLRLHEKIKVRLKSGIIETTPGRVLFNTIVPEGFGFQNYVLRKKKVGELVLDVYKAVGLERCVLFLDEMKRLGFAYATKGALSMGIKDICIPANKQQLVNECQQKVKAVQRQYEDGLITRGERHSKVIAIWTEGSETLSAELFELISLSDEQTLNPLYLMMDSGARASKSQVKQLGAMRGLMTKPSGEILESPITSNFREGLSALEYFISSHGARKGLADTALKTADSGYLTRRLVDVAQDVIVSEQDCGTLNGIELSAIKQGKEELLPLKERIFGRVLCEDLVMPGDRTQMLAHGGEVLTDAQSALIEDAGIESVRVRSTLTCETQRGVCTLCYGTNLATGRLIAQGEAVGIIAAQSIGEPGTQLTMRTFHLGGIAASQSNPELVAQQEGVLVYMNLRVVERRDQKWIALNKSGLLQIVPDDGRPLEEYKALLKTKSLEALQTYVVEMGTEIHVPDGARVLLDQRVASWEPHNIPILCEKPGVVKYEDLVEGISLMRELNKQTGQSELIVRQHRGELHPQMMVYADTGYDKLIGSYAIPPGAILSVAEGEFVESGDKLARLPRGEIRTKDITGGLPRIAELFEARLPTQAAEIAKIDGEVELKGVQKNKRIVVIKDKMTGLEEEHLIPLYKHLIVHDKANVVKGQPLTDGFVILQEILKICGVRELQKHLVNQVQEVYRLQGVDINDKHIELILHQMLKKVAITDPGDTTLLYGESIDKKLFHQQNKKVIFEGGKPAEAEPVLLGITKASLWTESFISAASFQETTRVLVEAASESKSDYLLDFKGPLITGHMIPGGVGFRDYQKRVMQIGDRPQTPLDFSFPLCSR